MKKILFILLLAFTISAANAQTSIRIIHEPMYDSLLIQNNYCCNKTLFLFYSAVTGVVHGYNPSTDSVSLKIYFGDGIDSTFKTNIHNDSLFSFASYTSHHYANIGMVDIKLFVIAPDGKKDSIIKNNYLVGDACDYIKSKVYNDVNEDCQYQTGESIMPFTYTFNLLYNNINVASSSEIHYIGSEYSILAPTGFTYDLSITNNINGNFCPAVHHITTVPSLNNDFGFHCTNNTFNLTGEMFGLGFRPGGNHGLIRATVLNYGCLAANGTVKLIYNNNVLTPNNSNQPYSVSGDTIIWNFTNLNSSYSFQTTFQPSVYFTISPLVHQDDTLRFTLIEKPLDGDGDTSNNVQHGYWIAINSCDPNDKQVCPQGEGVKGYIENNQNMFYTVRFQNTGTAEAENIYIIDTLDSNLDLGTFCVINSSHQTTANIIGANIIKFDMPNIFLPDSGTNQDASNGYVTYSIRQKPNLVPETKIKNTAYIYFDYNPAVVTNTTLNTIKSTTSIKEIKNENEISIYPNPSSGIFTVALGNLDRNCKVEVLNSFGQIVYESAIENQTAATIDLSRQAKGMYFIKVRSKNGVGIRKVIVE